MILTSAFVFFVSCIDAYLDAVGVRPPYNITWCVFRNLLFLHAGLFVETLPPSEFTEEEMMRQATVL
jgi:hypothetical protein